MPLPCRLLLLLCCLALPRLADAQSSRAGDNDMDPVRRCHATVRVAPQDALRMADALLARVPLDNAMETGALTCRAVSLQALGRSDDVSVALQQLQQLAARPGLVKRDRRVALFAAQTLMADRGDTSGALHILQELLDESTTDNDAQQQIMVLMGLAGVHSQGLGDDAGALRYLDRALDLANALNRAPHEGDVGLRYNRAFALLSLKRYDEADRALRDAEAMARRVGGQDLLLNRMAGHRAEIQRMQGRLDVAEAGLRRILPWQAANDPQGQVVTLQRLAHIELAKDRADPALALASEALALARRIQFVAEVRTSLELLFEVQTQRGDSAAALAVGRELRDLDQQRTRGQALDQLARLQTRTDQQLGNGQARDRLLERRDRLLRNAALVGLLLVVGVAWWLQHRHRRQRRQLQALGRNDRLTSLPNRTEAERRLGALPRARDPLRRTALLRIDVEGFKEFNDRHGQHAGDQALRVLADALRQLADEHDLLSRWGGRSLLVARADTTCEAATALAAQLQSRLSGLQLPGRGSESLQVSVGLAPLPLFAHGPAVPDDSLRAIDRCLQDVASLGHAGWAALWGTAEAGAVDVDAVLRNPLQAAAQDQVILASGGLHGWTGAASAAPAHAV